MQTARTTSPARARLAAVPIASKNSDVRALVGRPVPPRPASRAPRPAPVREVLEDVEVLTEGDIIDEPTLATSRVTTTTESGTHPLGFDPTGPTLRQPTVREDTSEPERAPCESHQGHVRVLAFAVTIALAAALAAHASLRVAIRGLNEARSRVLMMLRHLQEEWTRTRGRADAICLRSRRR